MVNGVTQLVMTKIDVLNVFEEISAAVAYKIDGMETQALPYDICDQELEPIFESKKGWKVTLDGIKDFDALPEAAKDYIAYIEQQLNVRISMVSTGPEREKLIVR
jgi:adenylosuccinate synthase